MSDPWDSRPPPIDAREPRARPRRFLRGVGIAFVGLFALAGVVVAALAVWAWFSAAEWEEAAEQGRAFAQDATDQGCLAAAADRLREDPPLLFVSLSETTWLSECLLHSAETEAFCEGVPDIYASDATLAYATEQCEASDLGDACIALYTQVSMHCAQRSAEEAE